MICGIDFFIFNGIHNDSLWWGDSCVPYSVNACRVAAQSLGLQIGNDNHGFENDTYSEKGCYAYSSGVFENSAFYGTGGTTEQMQTDLVSPKFRPKGYDCIFGKSTLPYTISHQECFAFFNIHQFNELISKAWIF